jgi:hypothetical protein
MRLRAVVLIIQMNELCVKILLARKQGQWVYYRINDELPKWALDVIRATLNGVLDLPPYQNDRQALYTMSNRPNQACC